MGKVKEYYQEQIDNDDYYFEPDVEYHMTYADKYGKWIPKLISWFNKKFANPKNYRTKYFQYVKTKKEEIPF